MEVKYDYRVYFINKIWVATLLTVLLIVSAELIEYNRTYLTSISIKFLFLLFIFFIYFIKTKLSFKLQALLLYLTIVLISFFAFYDYGMFGAGLFWLVSATFVLSVIFPLSMKAIYTGFLIILFAVYFFLLSFYKVTETEMYFNSPYPILGVLIPVVIFNFFLLASVTQVYLKIKKLVIELEFKKSEVEKLAHFDELTGAANLRLAKDRLEVAINLAKRNRNMVGVIYFDLDGFKEINDIYGHTAGDSVLKFVSENVNNVLRSSDTLCRVGGDEFFIILSELKNIDSLQNFAEKLMDAVRVPLKYDSTQLEFTVSAGLAIFPDNGETFDKLISVSDTNMYLAKRNGKNTYYPL